MAGQSLTSHEIASKLEWARDALTILHRDEGQLALGAVCGDVEAVTRIADIRVQVRQIEGDINILQRAQEAAELFEIADANARDAAYRARHLVIAKERAAEIVGAADRAERLIVELQSVLGEIAAKEKATWDALREAGEPPSSGTVGRKNLAFMALDRIVALIQGSQKFRADQRTTAEIARAAWSDLLDGEDGDDDII